MGCSFVPDGVRVYTHACIQAIRDDDEIVGLNWCDPADWEYIELS